MATTDEKVSKFLSAITSYAEEQKHSILDEVEAYKKTELDKAESEVLQGAHQLIQKETAEMRSNIGREMSAREMDSRRALLTKRQKITDEVFSRAKEKLIAFTGSPEYAAYLEKSAEEIRKKLPGEDTVLYVKEGDLSFRDTLQKAFGRPCPVKADDSIAIGGVKGVSLNSNLIADNSLDEKLQNQREWFALNSGLSVIN